MTNENTSFCWYRATINLPPDEWEFIKKVARLQRRSASSWARVQLIAKAEAEWAKIQRKKEVRGRVKGTDVPVSDVTTGSNVA